MEGGGDETMSSSGSSNSAASSSSAISLLCAVLFVKLPRAILASAGARGTDAAAAVLQHLVHNIEAQEAQAGAGAGGSTGLAHSAERLLQLAGHDVEQQSAMDARAAKVGGPQ